MPYVTEDNLTDVALERWKDIPDPRLRQIMQSLIKQVHGFVREIEPTQQEWATAIDWLTRTGKLCSQKRQEFILASDVLGVSMLVDAIINRRPSGATPSTVEGPFHVPNAPPIANGGDMAKEAPGIACFITGTVRGLDGEPVAGAVLISGRPTAKGCTRACATPPARGMVDQPSGLSGERKRISGAGAASVGVARSRDLGAAQGEPLSANFVCCRIGLLPAFLKKIIVQRRV